jgi:DNA-binding GntR family transcriptional regulator
VVDAEAISRTIAEHERIIDALRGADAEFARAAALARVCTIEASMRVVLAEQSASATRTRDTRERLK